MHWDNPLTLQENGQGKRLDPAHPSEMDTTFGSLLKVLDVNRPNMTRIKSQHGRFRATLYIDWLCYTHAQRGKRWQFGPQERIHVCKKALDQFRADLAAWTKLADDAKKHGRIGQTLQHWQTDADLAGIRDSEAVTTLPADEQEACKKA